MHIENVDPAGGSFDKYLDDIAKQLFDEKMKSGSIHPGLYQETAGKLLGALDKGLGASSFEFTDNRNMLKAYLEQNIYAFSAAKSLTELKHFRSLLSDPDGNTRSFKEFRDAVYDAGYRFNKNWLATEYDNTIASAQMAHKWQNFVDTGVDVLEYSTIGDDRVRPEHALLDGMTLPISSPLWRKYYPPLDWACRCSVIPGNPANVRDEVEAGRIAKSAGVPPLFQNNSGIDRVIFTDDHAYFNKIPKELDAVKNYGLKTVDQIYASGDLPIKIEQASESEYRAWWRDQKKVPGTDDILLKDKSGVKILFDSWETPGRSHQFEHFKDHIIQKSNQERWKYAANFPDIVTAPDEVWSVRHGKKLSRYYIKYYDDNPYVVVAEESKGKMIAQTMHDMTRVRTNQVRRGVLIFAKK